MTQRDHERTTCSVCEQMHAASRAGRCEHGLAPGKQRTRRRPRCGAGKICGRPAQGGTRRSSSSELASRAGTGSSACLVALGRYRSAGDSCRRSSCVGLAIGQAHASSGGESFAGREASFKKAGGTGGIERRCKPTSSVCVHFGEKASCESGSSRDRRGLPS